MTDRVVVYTLAFAALLLAMTAVAVSPAMAAEGAASKPPEASDVAKPSDYGVTEGERRTSAPEQMGAFVFSQRCSVCHARTADGPTNYGPHLEGIVGRKAGETGWSKQTDALKTSDVVWDEATLNKLLEDPQTAMPGMQMDVVIRFRRSRKALIAYLKTL